MEYTTKNEIHMLRSRIVELREMVHLYAGTNSELSIREHIQLLQRKVQLLLGGTTPGGTA